MKDSRDPEYSSLILAIQGSARLAIEKPVDDIWASRPSDAYMQSRARSWEAVHPVAMDPRMKIGALPPTFVSL